MVQQIRRSVIAKVRGNFSEPRLIRLATAKANGQLKGSFHQQAARLGPLPLEALVSEGI